VVLAAVLGRAARADEVTLENGDLLRGRVVSLDGRKLTLQADFSPDPIQLDWAAVRGLVTTDVVVVRRRDGDELRGRIVEPPEALGTDEDAPPADAAPGVQGPPARAELTIATDRGVYTVPAAEVVSIGPPRALLGWLEAGYAYSTGNDEGAHAIYGRAAVRYVSDKSYAALDAYAAATPDPSAHGRDDRREAILEGIATRLLGGRLFLDANGDLLTNTRREVDLRAIGGAGAGWRLDLPDDGHIVLDAGPVYCYEHRDEGSTRRDVAFRFGGRAESPLVGPLAVESRAFLLVGTERAEDLRARVLAGPRVRLWRGLEATVRAMYEYDGSPARDVRRHDASFEGGISWRF
jgi:hypothetical protein